MHEPTTATPSMKPSIVVSNNRTSRLGWRALSIGLFFSLWFSFSLFVGERVLPGPIVTGLTLWENIVDGTALPHLGISLLRILAAFTLTMLLGSAVGVAVGLSKGVDRFLSPWLSIGLSVPALVYIVLIYLSVGLNELAAIVATSITTVFTVIYNVREGVKSTDHKLAEMAKSFGAGRGLIIRKVIVPQLWPILMASARFTLGLTWRITTFVELIGRPNGVGFQIQHYYSMYNMSEVLSYAALFIIVMLCIEWVISTQLEPRLFAWRPNTSRV